MALTTKFVQARWYQPVSVTRPKRVIVIHDMEAPEKGTTAEAVAQMFATLPATRKASAHYCVDNDSAVQCVKENDIAYGAPGANGDGLHIEHAGYARQTRHEWLDDFGVAMLEISAELTAELCVKYGIPVKHLTNAELAAGAKGFVGHIQVSNVYHESTHTDPGDNFPWVYYISRVQEHYDALNKKPVPLDKVGMLHLGFLQESAREEPGHPKKILHPVDVRRLTVVLNKAGLLAKSGIGRHYGYRVRRAYKKWQTSLGITGRNVNGIPSAYTLKKLGAKYNVPVRVG